ncbi:hypothetical protein Tco_1458394 [Tanacetum coccineum]
MNYTPTVAEAVLASHQVAYSMFDWDVVFNLKLNLTGFCNELQVAAMNCSASNKDVVDVDVEQEFLFLDLKHHPQPVAAVDVSPNLTARPVELVPTSAAGRQHSAPLTASDAGSEHVGSSSVKLQGD